MDDRSSDHIRSIFQEIYRQDHWGGGSGVGSHVSATQAYRSILASVLGGSDVRSVVDAGCGDWQFSRLVDWSSVRYLGFDIVPELIGENEEQHGSDRVRFECADVRVTVLPKADMLICKDVLQHWDIESILRFLRRSEGRYRYMLITNDIANTHIAPDALNSEISIGDWRTLDLEVEPFQVQSSWRTDFDGSGDSTKRVLLIVQRRYRPLARLRRQSALATVRTWVGSEVFCSHLEARTSRREQASGAVAHGDHIGQFPLKADDIEIDEVSDGLIVYQPGRGRVHYLNHTAAIVLELCTGTYGLDQIGLTVQEMFGLAQVPDDEIKACLGQLRAEGLVV